MGEGEPALPPGASSEPRRPPDLGAVKRALRPLMVTLALCFVAYAAYDLAERWDTRGVSLRWGPLLASLLPIVLAAFAQAVAWVWLVDHLAGRRVPRAAAIALYLDSQMARYTPGKVGLPLVRIAGAGTLGVKGVLIASSVGIEHISWLAVGGALGFGSVAAWSSGGSGLMEVMGLGALVLTGVFAVVVVLLLGVDRRRLPRALTRLTGEGGQGPLLPLRVPLMHAVNWCCWGVHGVLLAQSVGAAWPAARAGFGVLILAPLAGFLALVAPAGAGVREAVLSVGLAPAVGAASAVVTAVTARVASLVADVGTWIIARAVLARVRRPPAP